MDKTHQGQYPHLAKCCTSERVKTCSSPSSWLGEGVRQQHSHIVQIACNTSLQKPPKVMPAATMHYFFNISPDYFFIILSKLTYFNGREASGGTPWDP